MSTIPNLVGLSKAEIDALIKAAQETRKDVVAQENARLADLLTDFVEDVVTSEDPKVSETSAQVGWTRTSIPMEVDGVELLVHVTITDVKAKEARKPLFDKKAKVATNAANAAAALETQNRGA